MTNLQGVRCVANSAHQATTEKKIQGWCADTGSWDNKTRDQGFCFGTTAGTHTSDAHAGLPESTPSSGGTTRAANGKRGRTSRCPST